MKSHILFLILFFTLRTAVADPLGDVSEYLGTKLNGACNQLEQQAFHSLNEIAKSQSCQASINPNENSQNAKLIGEQMFFEICHREDLAMLRCEEKKFSKFFDKTPSQFLDFVKEKAPSIRALDQEINSKISEWQVLQGKIPKNPNGLSLSPKDKELQLRADLLNADILNLEAQKEMIIKSIPFSSNPEMRDVIDAHLKDEKIDQSMRLRNSIYAAQNRLYRDISTLRSYTRKIPPHYKEKVAQDPVFMGHIAVTYGFDKPEIQPLMCHIENKYDKGAQALDAGLMVGSTLLTAGVGGALLNGVIKVGKISKLGQAAALQPRMKNGLKVLSIAGLGSNGLSFYRDVAKECSATVTKLDRTKNGSQQCTEEDVLKELEYNNCELAFLLPLMGGSLSLATHPKFFGIIQTLAGRLKLEHEGKRWAVNRPRQMHYQEISDLNRLGKYKAAKEYEEKLTTYMKISPAKVRGSVGTGISDAQYVEFPNGTVGIWKPKRVNKHGIDHDVQKSEIAAFKVDRFLGYNKTPITIEKEIEGQPGTVQLVVDSLKVSPDEYDPKELSLFDYLVRNHDRNPGNYLLTQQGHMVPIDHGLTFYRDKDNQRYLNPIKTLVNFSPQNEEAKKHVIKELQKVVGAKGPYLKLLKAPDKEWRQLLEADIGTDQMNDFFKRRDEIVQLVESARQKYGDVIFQSQ